MTLLRFAPLALLLLPAAAQAHVTLAETEAVAGRSFKAVAAVAHGCDGAATTAVVLKLPDGFLDAKPMPKAGWTLEIVEGAYARPHELHGKPVTAGPVEIRWSGGVLEDAWYDEFVVRGTFAAGMAGEIVPFPIVQECGAGVRVAWDEIAAAGIDPHSLAHPAPSVRVAAAGAEAGGHDMAAMAMPAAAVTVEGGFARAMLPNAKVGGGYLTIRNGADAPDRLVSAASPAAGRIQIHTSEMTGGVMKMREATDGIAVPAGGELALAPGGAHLMFLDLARPFAEGDRIALTLRFEKAGEVAAELAVGPPNAAAAPDEHAHH